MAWTPISLIVPQYENGSGVPYSGAVLKAYSAGTSTNISMATDSTGGTTFTSIALNASGYPVHNGSIVIPHVSEAYKIALYATQAAADANTPAIWSIDNNAQIIVSGSFSIDDAVSSGVTNVITATHTTTGTPVAGIGTGIALVTETASGNNETGMVIQSLTTDVTPTAENFDLVVLLMRAGATAAEKLRVKSTGALVPNGPIEALTGASIASASTVNLDSATGSRVHVTGVTTITAVTLTKGPRTVIFDGILTLTHHATNNNLPGATNITTAAGDRAIYESDGTTVYCVSYNRASGVAVAGGTVTNQATMETASNNTEIVTPLAVNWHPGVAKAWIMANGAGSAISASHNITSITDTGTGIVTVTIATDFSSGNYAIVNGLDGQNIGYTANQSAGSFQIRSIDLAGVATDPSVYYAACFGDQA
jgi:hypothetical protein